MEQYFKELKKKYKTHANVALLLGITPRHYVRIRQGTTQPKKAIQYMMESLLKDRKPE